MGFLYFYIVAVVLTLIAFLLMRSSLNKALKEKYTTEQLIELDGAFNNAYGGKVSILFSIVFPIVNILFALFYAFGIDFIVKKSFEELDKKLSAKRFMSERQI